MNCCCGKEVALLLRQMEISGSAWHLHRLANCYDYLKRYYCCYCCCADYDENEDGGGAPLSNGFGAADGEVVRLLHVHALRRQLLRDHGEKMGGRETGGEMRNGGDVGSIPGEGVGGQEVAE